MPPLAHLSDEALLALVARSDDDALAELYDRHGRQSYALALRILRDASLAQDAVQDAFLTAWRTAPSFDPQRGAATTWLMTLVHRRAVDLVRREDRRRAGPLDDPPIASGDATDEAAEAREQRRRVQAALAVPTPAEREAIELAYYGGLSQSEIADRLGVPLGTVKSRMFAGLARLRAALGEAGDGPGG
ncbi:MAG: sigma-70 family RNA polymerase sigma factor [Gaiellaceae bacterium]